MASLSEVATFTRKSLNSSVGRNVVSLYVLRFGNYVLPLITVPYLVRVLGPEKFGLVAFGQGLMAYFSLVVNYGFDWSATRKIAVNRDNPSVLNQIAADVWGAQTLLCILTGIVLIIILSSVPRLREISLLLSILYGSIVASMLFPTWIFQGLERMTVISATNLCVRALGCVSIFAFVHEPRDFLRYAVILSSQTLVAGIVGVAAAVKLLGLRLVLPSVQGIRDSIAEGSSLFLSTAAISLYTSGNAFVLGLMTDPITVGYYSAADKIVSSVLTLLGPISQAVFPHVNKLAHQSRELALRAGRKILLALGTLGLTMTVALVIAAPLIVKIVLGPNYVHSTGVLRILSFNILNISIATVWSTIMMISFRRDRAVMTFVFLAGVLNIGLAFVLVPLYAERGMAMAVVCAETLVNVGSFVYTWVHDINPMRIRPEASLPSRHTEGF
jgi:PST family polysaccharide transporter